MLSKRYESTEVDRRTWLRVPSGTHWSTSSDTHQVVEIGIALFYSILSCNFSILFYFILYFLFCIFYSVFYSIL